jgi:hypothetical protein
LEKLRLMLPNATLNVTTYLGETTNPLLDGFKYTEWVTVHILGLPLPQYFEVDEDEDDENVGHTSL